MPHDIADLFDAAPAMRDATGSLALVAELLRASKPALLLLADGNGEVFSAAEFSPGIDETAATSLARQMAERLAAVDVCRWECTVGDRRRLAFAVRLPSTAERAMLGGLLRSGKAGEERLDHLHDALLSCGALAWLAQRAGVEKHRLHARLQQMTSEQDTLRISHSEAVTSAIEEREQRLREEREHRARIQAVMQAAADGIITADERGRIETFNAAAERAFGYRADEVLGQSLAILVPSEVRTQYLELFTCYHQAGEPRKAALHREVTGLRKDGTRVPLDLAVSAVPVGEHTLLTAIARDISERKLREEELVRYRMHLEELVEERTAELANANKDLGEMCRAAEEANSAKSTFLANMSHELRTPLHGMLSFAAFGVKDAQKNGSGEMLNYFQKIETCGKTLLTLINDLLDLAKLEAGRATFDFGQVDLRNLLLQVADECSSRVAQRNIKVVPPPRDAVAGAVAVADPIKLGQVVRNLLDNAIKFSPDGGIIEIGLERTPRTFKVSVADRGVGIPEGELEAIFDKFIQSSKTRTAAGGTGLGLAISREIIAAHKGRVWAENRPDGGAVMMFEIPVNLHEVGAATESGIAEKEPLARGDSPPLCTTAAEDGKT
jgi:two-component system, LuxR family, sensor kinase FixL